MDSNKKGQKFSGGYKPSLKIWKKWWFWALIVAALIGGIIEFTEPKDEERITTVAQTEVEPEETEVEPTETEETETGQTEQAVAETKTEQLEEQTEEIAETVEHRVGMYGISDKNIDDIGAHFSVSNARNDVTGNWRISTIAEPIQLEEYALSYYEKYFSDNKEVHVIVNFTYNTSTTITCLGDVLDVSVHEYVDKEEHDAKIMCSGMLLAEYYIYLDNGDIEEIQ